MIANGEASVEQQPTARTPVAGESGWAALAALMLATLLANFASVCLFPQIVSLSAEFDHPVSRVVWTLVAFDVVSTGVGGVAAALGAVVGNRRMLVLTLVLLAGGSLMAALSTGLTLLVIARAVQGVAMAAQALSIGIIANFWRGESMRRAISMIVLSMGIGGVVAYLAGGLIVEAGGDWRVLFWGLGAAAVVDVLLTMALVKETKRAKGLLIDYPGCAGLIVWAVLLLLPLSQANSWGWSSGKVLGSVLSGLVVMAVWVWWELRSPAPLIDLRLLARPGVWQGAVVVFSMSVALCVPSVAVPYLFQTPATSGFGFGKSILVVSVALAVPALLMILLSATTAGLMRRLGARSTMLVGLVFGLSGFGMALAHGSVWINLVWLAATGVMAAWAGSAAYAVGAEAVPPQQGVIVSTIYHAAGGIGASLAAAVAGYVLGPAPFAVRP